MPLTYQLREADMAAYARHMATRPGKIRELLQRNNIIFVGTYIIGVLVAFLFVIQTQLIITLIIALVTAIPFFFFYKAIALSRYVSRVMKLSSSGNSFQVRNCVVEIAEDGLHSSSELGTSTIFWASIQNMEETSEYIYLLLQGVNAVVIPKRAFATDTALQEFRTTVSHYLSLSDRSLPTS